MFFQQIFSLTASGASQFCDIFVDLILTLINSYIPKNGSSWTTVLRILTYLSHFVWLAYFISYVSHQRKIATYKIQDLDSRYLLSMSTVSLIFPLPERKFHYACFFFWKYLREIGGTFLCVFPFFANIFKTRIFFSWNLEHTKKVPCIYIRYWFLFFTVIYWMNVLMGSKSV